MVHSSESLPLRIAVVGLFDSEERDKLALILHGIQRAGHTPVLVDAELFAAGRCWFGRAPGGRPVIQGETRVAVVDGIEGHHRNLDGVREQVVVNGVAVLAADPAGTLRAANAAVAVDAVWPDALDIARRLEFEGLYRGLAEQRIPSLAGSWDSVLNATFKHRMRAVLDGVPQPRFEVLDAAIDDAGIERARGRLSTPSVWVKAPDDSHSHGVSLLPPGANAAAVVRRTMRETPDGTLCLMEEDIRGIVQDPAGRRYRADQAVTVLDGRVIHAALRVQPDLGSPTNSLRGGRSLALAPGSLHAEVRRIAVGAVTATGSRYGSADILGGLAGVGPYTVVHSPRPVVCEVNKMPGGRSPGFLPRVIGPLVAAYVAAGRLIPRIG